MTIEDGSKRHPAGKVQTLTPKTPPPGSVAPIPAWTHYRTLDPVRGAALAAAVQLPYLWPAPGDERPDVDEVLRVADRFTAWLDPKEAHGQT